MKNTYTIPEANRETVEKLIARYQKKAEMYNIPMTVEYGSPYAKEIDVFEDYAGTRNLVRTDLYEVFDLTIESEIIRKDGYTVVAKIEHLEGGNVVYTFGDFQCLPEWTTMAPHCDHCNGDHGQKITFIVRHEDGSMKQVGRTCLKDYCGIDPQSIGWANQLNEILLNEDVDNYDWVGHPIRQAYTTSDVLALAVGLQRTKGYTSSSEIKSNKSMLIELVHDKKEAEDRDIEAAEEIEKAIKQMTVEEAIGALLDNVKTLLECGYCKQEHFGYIAYAPLAYERYQKKLAEEAARNAEKNAEREQSQYIGEIKQRLEIEVSDMALLTSWENNWGYTYLYKIVDTLGNVLIWYASRFVDEEAKKMRVTVKDHSERDGVRQTIVTNCSVVA